jgi:hypothetical protein
MSAFLRYSSIVAAALAALPAAALAQNSSLDNLTASQAFPAWQSTQKYQLPGSGGPIFYGNFARINTTIQYDHPTQSYTVRDTGSVSTTSTFAPADIDAGASNTTYTVYSKNSGTETLKLLNPGAGNPLIALTYTSYGQWTRTTAGGGYNGADAVNDTFFVYGIKTASGSMPTSGSAVYNTVIDGTFVNSTSVYDLSGTGSITANFGSGTGTISFAATPVGTPSVGAVINFGTINGSGVINAATFKGSGSGGGYSMNLAGYFYGPTANEVGADFRLSGNGGNGQGVMVGKQ